MYMNRKGSLIAPVYNTSRINRKNATYSRILKHLEKDYEIWFTECSRCIADNHKTKFPTDLLYVRAALNYDNWFAVVAFGKQAEEALEDLKYVPFDVLPHPVSYKWRKQDIITLKDRLYEHSH